MKGGAEFSGCRAYRYTLWREWDASLPTVNFVGLNPSTATETVDDPTIRRCVRFAQDWGYGRLFVTNIFAFRATDPADMKRAADPIGPDNGRWLRETARSAGLVIAAWGAHGEWRGRGPYVLTRLQVDGIAVHCLGVTKDGHPKHPLYLRADTRPILWRWR